ncbi:MAG TPA: patatin-like phospholipase family protein [Rhodanobacteraceae bacterium]|nr:patatin-like phospholipase family protein [Rhodanobacteraceae bacterium]
MARCAALPALAGLLVLGGCVTQARLPPPPNLISSAVPIGFSDQVRLVTIDRPDFDRRAPQLFSRLSRAATDGTIDYLVISGGGGGGSFGAGALVGMSRRHDRPKFEVVTGVSAGALIAPFAYLGPQWDPQLEDAFAGLGGLHLPHSATFALMKRFLFPLDRSGDSALFKLVDKFVTPAMIKAVARDYQQGRLLFIATTDLDKEETVLWNMGLIAQHGGKAARQLFRNVLVASASVPGIFPPVMIRVRQGTREYEEMHVDGSVTTSLFAVPLVAQILPGPSPTLPRANLYVIINGKLVSAPVGTPANTLGVLSRSFSADLTYKAREALVTAIDYARRRHMRLSLTEIPPDYPYRGFADFDSAHMRQLFDYGARCASSGQLWETVAQSLRRDLRPGASGEAATAACPAGEGGGPGSP